MEKEINFCNKEQFIIRYNKIYKMLPFHKYKSDDFERHFMFSLRYKKLEYYIKDLEWEKQFCDIILNTCKYFIGNLYESNKHNPDRKKFMLDNKNLLFLNIFHLIIILSNDDISEDSMNYKTKFIENFYSLYCFNEEEKIKDVIYAKKYLMFIISIRENFLGYIFHFYLNLPNLMEIKNLQDLLSIKKIVGDFKLEYTQSTHYAIFDYNVRYSFKKPENTIVIDNRDKLFYNYVDCFTGKCDSFKSTSRKMKDLDKKRNSLFIYYKKEFSFENLSEIKEFFSPFRFTFYLIYGHFYESYNFGQ